MILQITFVTIFMLMGNSADDSFSALPYLSGLSGLSPSYDILNLFDGPSDVSHAETNPTTSKRPTREQMIYYAYYAASAYCPYELDNLNCESCKKFKNDVASYKVLTNDTHNTLALITVSHSRQEIVITFRGSENFWNFVLDFYPLNVNVSEDNIIKIHKGFYIALMSLYSEIVKTVNYQRVFNPNYKIVIVGHRWDKYFFSMSSVGLAIAAPCTMIGVMTLHMRVLPDILGGSMARLCEFFFLFKKQFSGVEYEVYTYGDLRSGNKFFIDYINNQPNVTTARVVNRRDHAPHIIPTSIVGTQLFYDYYLHAQTEYWLNENGDRFCNNSVYEDATCSDSSGLLLYVVDHVTYFGINFFYCFADQPLTFSALPFDTFNPVETVPPFPDFISDVLGGFSDIVLDIIGPILGR